MKEKLINILTSTPINIISGLMIGYFFPIGKPTFGVVIDLILFSIGIILSITFFYLKYTYKNKTNNKHGKQ